MYKHLTLLFIFLAVQVPGFNQQIDSESKDLQIIREHLLETIWIESVPGVLENDPVKDFGHLEADGSWADITEKSKIHDEALFEEHLSRTLQLSFLYAKKGNPNFHNEELKEKIIRSLKYWIEKDPVQENWWYNEIGVPNMIYKIALLMQNDLPPHIFSGCMKILGRSQIKLTGQNLLWLSQINIARGCLQNDEKIITKAFDAIKNELSDTLKEGICPDNSFHQHGQLLYSGGYGSGFALYAARLSYLAHQTRFAFPKSKIAMISRYLLDGEQWMVVNKVFDFATIGREISRKGNEGARTLEIAGEYMIRQNPDRTSEMKDLNNNVLKAGRKVNFKPYGNRYFWNSDYMVHRREGYFFSVHNSSLRMLGSESINGEGLKSYHLGDGVVNLQVTGNEFESIFPVWDWQKLPGITYVQNHQDVPRIEGYEGFRGKTSFVGGISDGMYGMAFMDYKKDSVVAHKAWFCFDKEIVCLGSNIISQRSLPLYTSVNQCLLNGDVYVKSSGIRLLHEGDTVIEHVNWIHHNRVLYLFPETHTAEILNKFRTGSWHDINEGGNASSMFLKVFGLYIEHEKNTVPANYYYIIVPGVNFSNADSTVKSNPIQVIQNNVSVQAVYHKELKISLVAFYQPANIELNKPLKLGVDKSCLLMLHEEKGMMRLYISNPENKGGIVNVAISLKLSGKGCKWNEKTKQTIVSVNLPTGREAGSTVATILKYGVGEK